jgi:TRAP-type C4-dicarboxylate transport system substrate-binding protein
VEAQENPLTTIEAKKFYEVQKHIVLTGHIVDHLNTIISGGSGRSSAKRIARSSPTVAQEAAAKATGEIKVNEAKLSISSSRRVSPSPRSTRTSSVTP